MSAPPSNYGPVRVFVSFSSKDEGYLQDLEKHLSALKREGAIEVWTHHALLPGEHWEPTLLGALHSAELIILLVSADFMASDYIQEKELAATLERHRRGDAWVAPVLIRSVDMTGMWFDELQWLPPGRRPISQWRNRDEAWTAVATGIRALLPRLLERRTRKPPLSRMTLLVPLLAGLGLAAAWRHGIGGQPQLPGEVSFRLEAWAFTSEGALEAPLFRPLEDGAAVKSGPIQFGLLVSQPAYVRLFSLSQDGKLISQYPEPGEPPLLAPGGERYVIPREQCCLILGRPGQERFLVVAAKRPDGPDAAARELVAGMSDQGSGGAVAPVSLAHPDKKAGPLEGQPGRESISFWTGSAVGGVAAGTHFRSWPGTSTLRGDASWKMLTFRHIAEEEAP